MNGGRQRAGQTTPVTEAVRSIVHITDRPDLQRAILIPGERTLRAVEPNTRQFFRRLEARRGTRPTSGQATCGYE